MNLINLAGAGLRRRVASWSSIAAQFAIAETSSYLRSKSAIFWTFIYPIALLVLMVALFGERSVQMTVDIEGRGLIANQLASTIESRSRHMDGLEIRIKRVSTAESTPANRVRLVVDERSLSSHGRASVKVLLRAPPDSLSGAMLAITGEVVSSLNLTLAGTTATVGTEYIVRGFDTKNAAAPGSDAYYVTGLAVLTLVSTALFGLSAPLIELRSRGCLQILRVMPIPRSAFLTGFALCRIGILFVFILAYLVGGLALIGDASLDVRRLSLLAVLVLVSSTAFLAAGLALAGIITQPGTASAVINLLNLPIMFLSDLFIPVSALPAFLQSVVEFSPVHMLAASMRAVVLDQTAWRDLLPCLIGLCTLGCVSTLLAALTFRWTAER